MIRKLFCLFIKAVPGLEHRVRVVEFYPGIKILISTLSITYIDTINLVEFFSNFYNSHSELIVKYNNCFETLLQEGILETVFYGDLVYKIKS